MINHHLPSLTIIPHIFLAYVSPVIVHGSCMAITGHSEGPWESEHEGRCHGIPWGFPVQKSRGMSEAFTRKNGGGPHLPSWLVVWNMIFPYSGNNGNIFSEELKPPTRNYSYFVVIPFFADRVYENPALTFFGDKAKICQNKSVRPRLFGCRSSRGHDPQVMGVCQTLLHPSIIWDCSDGIWWVSSAWSRKIWGRLTFASPHVCRGVLFFIAVIFSTWWTGSKFQVPTWRR